VHAGPSGVLARSEDLFLRFMIDDFGHLTLQSNLKGTQTMITTLWSPAG
jgi:hypothetical protein